MKDNYNAINLSQKLILPNYFSSAIRLFLLKKLVYLDLIILKKYRQNDFDTAIKNVKHRYRFNLKILNKIIMFYSVFVLLFFRLVKNNFSMGFNLVYGLDSTQIFRNANTDNLYNFFNKLFDDPYHNQTYVVETNAINKLLNKNRGIFLSQNIDLFLYASFLTSKQKFRLILQISCRLFYFLYNVHKYKLLVLIWKQFIFQEPLYKLIEEQVSEANFRLLTTQSEYRNLPFIFEYFKHSMNSIMIWYSANSVPITYKNEKQKRVNFATEIYKVLPVKNHLVWTTDHAKYLKSMLPNEVNVIVSGSLMFYVPENISSNKIYDITIFDASPYTSSRLDTYQKIPFALNSIYSESYIIEFLTDIIETVNLLSTNYNRNFSIAVKYKRGLNSLHSQKYRNFMKKIELMENITIVNHQTNLYDLISQSKSVVGFPFVSPAVIAKEMDTPVVYYSSSDIMATYSKFHGVQVVQSLKGLQRFLKKFLI